MRWASYVALVSRIPHTPPRPPGLTWHIGVPLGVPRQKDERLVARLPRQPVPAVRRAVLEVQTLADVVLVDLVALKHIGVAHRLSVAERQWRVLHDGDERTPDAEEMAKSAPVENGARGGIGNGEGEGEGEGKGRQT